MSRRTIYALIEREGFPPGRKIPGKGPRRFWEPEAVSDWLKAHPGAGVQG